MMLYSTLVLDSDDLQDKFKNKETKDIVPSDFKPIHYNIIKACKIVMYNEFGKEGSEPVQTIIFKSEATLKGTIK